MLIVILGFSTRPGCLMQYRLQTIELDAGNVVHPGLSWVCW
jgi:hypothetical protein